MIKPQWLPPISLPALTFYLLFPIFPIWLILSPFLIVDPGEIYGASWHVLLALGSAFTLFFLFDDKSFVHIFRLIGKQRFRFIFSALIGWLLLMGVAHGFGVQNLTGVLSGLCFVLMLPCLAITSRAIPSCFSALVCLWCGSVVLMENYFLLDHIREGVALSSLPIYDFNGIPLQQLPRIFRNVRDGNSIAILSIISGLCLFPKAASKSWSSTHSQNGSRTFWLISLIVAIFSASMGFFHGLITAGRGVFLAVAVGIVCLGVAAFVHGKMWRKLWLNISFLTVSFLLALASYKLYLGGEPVAKVANRFNAVISSQEASPRLLMWTQAIQHRLSTHSVLGEGFNFYLDPIVGNHVMNPHNILVMLFLYAGLSGLTIFFFLLCGIMQFLMRHKSSDGFDSALFASAAMGSYLMVHSVLSWSAGCWAVCISSMIVVNQLLHGTTSHSSGNFSQENHLTFGSKNTLSIARISLSSLYLLTAIKLISIK